VSKVTWVWRGVECRRQTSSTAFCRRNWPSEALEVVDDKANDDDGNAGNDGDAEVTTCDDTDAGTNVVTEPGVDANIEAAGADASTGVDPGADAGADNGTDSGADADHEAGADAGADSGSDASADTGSDAGADASADADNDHVSLKLFSKRFFDLNVDSVGRVFELTHALKVVMSDILVSRL